MNDSPFATIGDEPVEARIVAWVLGEASTFEVAELERLCEERPELLIFRRRMCALHGLLTEAESAQPDEGWKLPQEKRQRLNDILGKDSAARLEVRKEQRIRHSGRRALYAIAACVMLSLVLLFLFSVGFSTGNMSIQKAKKLAAKNVEMRMAEDTGNQSERRKDNLFKFESASAGPEGNNKRNDPGSTVLADKSDDDTDGASADSSSRNQEYLAARRKSAPSRPPMSPLAVQAAASRAPIELPPSADEKKTNAGLSALGEDHMDMLRSGGAVAHSSSKSPPASQPEPEVQRTRALAPTPASPPSRSPANASERTAGYAINQENAQSLAYGGGEGGGYAKGGRPGKLTGIDGYSAEGKELGKAKWTEKRAEMGEKVPVLEDRPTSEADHGRGLTSNENIESAKQKEELVRTEAAPSSTPTASQQPSEESAAATADPFAPEATDPYASDEMDTSGSLTKNDQPARPVQSKRSIQENGRMGAGEKNLAENKPGAAAPMPVLGARLAEKAKDNKREDASLAMGDASGEGGSLAANGPSPADGMLRARDQLATANKTQAAARGDEALAKEMYFMSSDLPALSKDAKELNKTIRAQEDKVEERRKLLATIVRTKGIIYKGQDSFYSQSGVDEDQGARSALQDYQKLEAERQQLQSQIKSLLKYDDAQLMVYAAGIELPDNIIRNLLPQYEEAKKQVETLKTNGLGDDHPSVLAAARQTENMKRQMDEGVINLRATLQAQLDMAEKRLKSVEVRKNETRDEAIKRGLDAQDYVDAKRDFERDQKILQQMRLRQVELALESQTPKPAPRPDLSKLTEEIATTEDPYSTFSLNVSDASFKIAQAALARGERPDPAGIKAEQFYNAVDYGDPAPAAGEPVAVNIEQSAHPIIPGRNLVRVALKTAAAGRSAAQPLRLTLLVDQSGSMVRDDRRAAMDKAMDGFSKLLTKNDLVTVIGFSRKPHLLAEGITGDQAAKLKELVNQASCEGGTNLEEAIKLGELVAERNKLAGAQNRIVLFTDGAANLGDANPAHLTDKVKAMRQKGLALDIAGIAADELNDGLLGDLARSGNGRYYVVGKDGGDDIAAQLAGAFHPAAENVKVQVRFNPERVAHYKLIGFEKDRLKTEDFRNDAVAAAQLAAEEAGVAIYQVETLPNGNGELGEVSVRFRKADCGEMVERTWTIPHNAATPALDRATPSMQLSVLAMLAAEKLRGGPLGQAIDFKQLTAPRANVRAFYGNTGRVAEMLHMIDSL